MTSFRKPESISELYKSYKGVYSEGKTTNPMPLEQQVEQYKRRWLKYLPQDYKTNFLDIGCGGGEFLLFLSICGYKNLKGIDISPDQINRAEKIGLKNVSTTDAFSFLMQSEEEYDVISALNLLEHLKRDELFDLLKLSVSKLSKNGLLIGVVPNSKSIFSARVRYADLTHEISFTPESLYQLFHVAGLSDVKVYEHGPLIHSITSLIR